MMMTNAGPVLDSSTLTRENIATIEKRIRPYIRRTPVMEADAADFGLPSARMVLKLESLQHAGSFKARGAFANLLTRKIPPAGIVAASGGNHGVAVAYAASKLGIPAKIFVPVVASAEKIERIRNSGADLVIGGERYADALAASERWIEQSGAMAIHAYDQIETMLGQGTVGLEFEQQDPGLDTLLVAVGGGGLIAGIASWYAPAIEARRIKVIGIEPEAAPTLTHALRAGRPVDSPAGGIAADSLAPTRVGGLTFPVAQRLLDSVVLVSDEAIFRAMDSLWRTLRVLAEPGGAAAFAAVHSGAYQAQPGERVGVLVCGGNSAAVDFVRIAGARSATTAAAIKSPVS
jgi:threonine dehydratase